ncbi:hypothetical protein LCGC14_2627690 [marine sediment metagenome]|uniref:Uncharacterized protein n=1 Tax=marine sediment metagenome TaxID=412755 RepID=A0A0F9A152_9ZZZZ
MKEELLHCDIEDGNHHGNVKTLNIDVIFDHDQDDGKSKMKPYLSRVSLEICEACETYMFTNRKYIYAYGAMGHNTYII